MAMRGERLKNDSFQSLTHSLSLDDDNPRVDRLENHEMTDEISSALCRQTLLYKYTRYKSSLTDECYLPPPLLSAQPEIIRRARARERLFIIRARTLKVQAPSATNESFACAENISVGACDLFEAKRAIPCCIAEAKNSFCHSFKHVFFIYIIFPSLLSLSLGVLHSKRETQKDECAEGLALLNANDLTASASAICHISHAIAVQCVCVKAKTK
jgi:hypothetical protein